ncbi:hypothetical protein M378DRAFT_163695, partial [Amanita muscaria Koide BX008]
MILLSKHERDESNVYPTGSPVVYSKRSTSEVDCLITDAVSCDGQHLGAPVLLWLIAYHNVILVTLTAIQRSRLHCRLSLTEG